MNLHKLLLSHLLVALYSISIAQDAKLVIQSGHTKTVTSSDITSDGKYLITGGEDNICVLWDVNSQKAIQYFVAHSAPITSVTISPDNSFFVSTSKDKTLMKWDLFTGEQLQVLKGHTGEVNDAVITDQYIISGSFDGTLKVWNITTGALIKTIKTLSSYKIILTPDKKQLVNSSGYELEWWDIATFKKTAKLTPGGMMLSYDFMPDGKTLVTGSGNIYTRENNSIRFYDAQTRVLKKTIPFPNYVAGIAISSDGKYIAIPETIFGKIYDANTMEELKLKFPSGKKVQFIPGTNYLLTAGGYSGTNLIDIQTSLPVKSFVGHAREVKDVCFDSSGKAIYSGGWDKHLRKWDLENGKLENSIKIEGYYVLEIDCSPNGELILERGGDNEFNISDKNLTKETWNLNDRFSSSFCTFLNDSIIISNYSQYVSAKSAHEYFIQLINLNTKKITNKIKSSSEYYEGILTPNKEILVARNENSVVLFDMKTGQIKNKLQGYSKVPLSLVDNRGINSIAISNNGKWLAAGIYHEYADTIGTNGDFEKYKYRSKYTIRIWDIESGKIIKDLEGSKAMVSSLCFSPGDQTLVSSTSVIYNFAESIIRVWDLQSFSLTKTLEGHSNVVNKLSYSPDGKFIVSASVDGTIRLWNATTYEMTAVLLAKDQYDYIIATPDNYYTSSKAGVDLMAFNYQNKGFPFEQFDLQLNRPDIVLQRLGYASPALIESYKKAYEKRLKKTGFTESMFSKDFQLPVLTVPNQNLALSTKEKSTKLFVSASDSLYKLDRINVLVNGVPVNGLKGISIKEKQTFSFSDSIDIRLSSGVNKIVINSMNSAGATSLPFQYTITCTDNSRKPDLYLISVGVSEYKSTEMNLTYATKDAKDLSRLLAGSTGKFGNIIVDTIFDRDMTVEKILSLKNKLANTKEDDQVIVFIAGHGLLDADLNYYLATHEIDFMNPSKKGLAYEQLEHILDGIPARKKLLLMDACHSGEVDKEEVQLVAKAEKTEEGEIQFRSVGNTQVKRIGLENSFEMMKNLFTDLRKGSGTIVISSAGGGEYAMEGSEWKNGVFTYSLLKGLKEKKADLNKDGKIMASELQEYLQQSVSELTKGKQKPTSRTEILENDFQIW